RQQLVDSAHAPAAARRDDNRACAINHGDILGRCYATSVTRNAIAASVMTSVVSQPRIFIGVLLARSPMSAVSLEISMINARSGGASKPLMIAVKNSALIGLIPRKLTKTPTSVPATTIA